MEANIVGIISSVKMNKTFSPKNKPSEKEVKALYKEKPEIVKEKIKNWSKIVIVKSSK